MMQTCRQCSALFEITESDLAFYDKISPVFSGKKYQVHPPTLCPDCRRQRRLAFINVNHLYKRNQNGKKLISPYSAEKNINVVPKEEWWSDRIDGKEFGQEIHLQKSFFLQFANLQARAPHWDRYVGNCENCDWTLNVVDSKDCYLVRSSKGAENCLYSDKLYDSHHIIDGLQVVQSELCAEVIEAQNCFEVFWSLRVENCNHSAFLYDCSHLSNCIGCVGLRHKEYHVLNEKVSADEFDAIWKNILSDADIRAEYEQKFQKLKQSIPQRAQHILNSENCSGDEISNCKNIQLSFEIMDSQDGKYLDFGSKVRDSMDCSQPDYIELCYETSSTYKLYNSHFCFNATDLEDCWYCATGVNLKHCFGCVGLKNAAYCVFNKQYTKDEYEILVPKVIENMKKRIPLNPPLRKGEVPLFEKEGLGEIPQWGEFFPIAISPFAYNETIAAESFPLSQQEIEANGWTYKTPEEMDLSGITKKIPAEKLPDAIADIPDDILNWAIICSESGRPFKIQKAELDLYRKTGLPVPHLHPDVRYLQRKRAKNARKLWARECDNCGKEIKTTYHPSRPEKIFCEKCYLETVY